MKRGQHPNSLKNLLSEPPMEARVKGGIKSAEVRKKRKELQEVVNYLIDLPVREGELDELESLVQAKSKNLTVKESMIIAQIKKALTGDTRAFNSLIDITGERPQKYITISDDDYDTVEMSHNEKLVLEYAKKTTTK